MSLLPVRVAIPVVSLRYSFVLIRWACRQTVVLVSLALSLDLSRRCVTRFCTCTSRSLMSLSSGMRTRVSNASTDSYSPRDRRKILYFQCKQLSKRIEMH